MNSHLTISDKKEFAVLSAAIILFFSVIIAANSKLSPILILSSGLVCAAGYILISYKGALTLLFLSSGILFLENDPGIQLSEVPFYLLLCLFSFHVMLKFIRGNLILSSFLDKLFLLFHILLLYGLLLGLINGAQLYTSFGELAGFSGLLLYFPLRELFKEKKYRKSVFIILALIALFVVIRNLINYRELLIQTVISWQAEKARVASNEIILVFGAFLTMTAAALTHSRVKQLLLTFVFVAFFGSLILTQSRGYWLAFFIGFLFIFYTIDFKGKRRILLSVFILGITSFLAASIFFGDFLDLVIKGLSTRFNSLGSGKLDISLQERVLESKTVIGLILQNPVAGYGLGYTYTKKILFFDYFTETSYIHNGYLAAWFKFGIVGFVTLISVWFTCIYKSFKIFNSTNKQSAKVLSLTIGGTVTGMLLVNNTSPQILTFESLLILTIFCAFLSTQSRDTTPAE